MFGLFSRNQDVPGSIQKLEAGFWPELVGQVRLSCVGDINGIFGALTIDGGYSLIVM